MEVYKEIIGFKDYKISNYGNVISIKFGKIKHLKLGLSNRKAIGNQYYHFVCMKDKVRYDFYPHKLVCEYFVGGKKDGLIVDHIDGDRLNNHYTNLRYTTQKENILKSNFKNKSSKYPYVMYLKRTNTYIGRIKINGVEKSFSSKTDEGAFNRISPFL